MHIRVAALNYRHSVALIKDNLTDRIMLGGVYGKFLDFILSKINISYTVVSPKDGEAGVRRRGNWTGSFGMIQNNEADMVLGPFTVTAERMEIVKFSEGLYTEEVGLLSSRVERHFYKDVLAQFNSLEGITLISLIVSTLSVILFICLERKMNFFHSFWMVLKAICSKPIKSNLSLNLSTLILMVYFICIVFFWININQVVGAYMRGFQKESTIKSIEDIYENGDTIPTVIRGSSNEYLFRNQFDPGVKELWDKMRKKGEQGLIIKSKVGTQEFLESIMSKERVFILGTSRLTILVIHFCEMNPNCNLFVSNKFMTALTLAFGFKNDFDPGAYSDINQIIINLKEVGIISVWQKQIFSNALNQIKQNKKRVLYCILNAIHPSSRLPKTIRGELRDFKPVFKLMLLAISVAFLVFINEIMIKFVQIFIYFH